MVKLTLRLEPLLFNIIIDHLDYDSYCNFLKIFPKEFQKELVYNFQKYKIYKNPICDIISKMLYNKQITKVNVYMNYYSKIFMLCSDSHINELSKNKSHKMNIVEAFNYLIFKISNTDYDEITVKQIINVCTHLNKTFNCYCTEYKDSNYYLENKDKLYEVSLKSLNMYNVEKNNYLKMFKGIG